MKCYYEVLDVPRDANDGDIKTAYRKLALKWHPDKNLENPDLAKEQFQIVQQAYEVLSDRQERAWYDNHREQILRGSNTEFEDNCLDVFQYFTTSCFKGYDDSERGFYTVYRTVFEKIAKEDMEFMDDKEEFCEIPGFGNSQSDYAGTVGPFYAYWMSYSTKKSYVWLDPYNINETRERRVVKLIEKENKKVRQKAKKERNDEIRSLVAFVRKRDKRVQAYNKLMEEKALENRKKQEKINQQRRLERQKLNESATQAEWAKFDNVKSGLEEIEKHLAQQFGESSGSEFDEEDINNLYCPACNKLFKTTKAFENHESSKKHKENVEKLRQQMLEEEDFDHEEEEILDEEDGFLENEDEIINGLSGIDDNKVSNSDEDELLNETENHSDSEENKPKTDTEEELNMENSDSELGIKTKQKKKNKKVKNVLNACDSCVKEEINLKISISEEEFDFASSKKQKKKNKKNNVKLKPDNVTPKNPEIYSDCDSSRINEEESKTTSEEIKISSSSKKRKDKKSKKNVLENASEVDLDHCCVTCHSNFPSKNKLFDHLKKTGHGVYIPKTKHK